MLFSSTIFLFAFLPIVLTLYFALRTTEQRNLLLLLASLFFYAWGEIEYTALLLLSIGLNHVFGLWIESTRARERRTRMRVVTTAVAANLALLGFFKYANFAVDNLNAVLHPLGVELIALEPVHLPIGISFFTFQAITYIVDIHRGHADAQRNPLRVALYIALFPQLIAGPIVRYREIAAQLAARSSSAHDVAEGVRRFVIGLGKKVLIANSLAIPADRIFAIPADSLQTPVAWLGVVCFTLQIYFDFSGYSDMAIGLGRIFGFRFPENFRFPYVAESMRDYWRRWHISLTNWFRDYLFFTLGGGTRGAARARVNLFLVFLLCGLWHGASWNFAIWGLIHGGFLALERTSFVDLPIFHWRVARHVYTLGVVVLAYVFFRCDTLPEALVFLRAMAGLASTTDPQFPVALYLDRQLLVVLPLALLGATPWLEHLRPRLETLLGSTGFAAARIVAIQGLLLGCAMALVAGTHNPFIYFRF